MSDTRPSLRTIRILLTVMSLEFFGPALRDAGPSHATNPDWVGHARLHVVWFIALLVISGVINLYLIWGPRSDMRDLTLSTAWQASTIGGFWTAVALAPAYGGIIVVPGLHSFIFGVEENLLFFCFSSVLWVATATLLARARSHERASLDEGAGTAVAA